MAYSNDLRTRAVEHYLTINRNYKEVATLFHIGIATLHDWVQRYLSTGDLNRKKSTGRPRLISESEHDVLRKMVLDNSDNSLESLSEKWCEVSGMQASTFTISRSIRRLGLSYKKNLYSQ